MIPINKNAITFLLLSTIVVSDKYAFSFTLKQPVGIERSLSGGNSKLFGSLFNEDGDNFEHAIKNGKWKPPKGVSFSGLRRKVPNSNSLMRITPSSTSMKMSEQGGAVMPDGGLNPCVIKVIGVGGGGCNAVSLNLYQ